MEFLTLWSLFGFLFAVYAVTANDSIQTLGTFISSNRDDVKWYWMFVYMGSISWSIFRQLNSQRLPP